MYINDHYPFDVLPLNFNPGLMKDFCNCGVLYFHHDELYRKSVEMLNYLLCNYPDFHSWSLEELIFNDKYLPEQIRLDIVYYAGKVYNHQIYFNSLCNNSIYDESLDVVKQLCKTYGSIDEFKKLFIEIVNNYKYSGYIWVVCNNQKEVFIYSSDNEDTLVKDNLYQLFGIDLWEHSYICCMNKNEYVCSFLNHLNWQYINYEYLEAIKKLTY